MTKRTCAFLTMENIEGFFCNDNLTYRPLAELGWSVAEVPWDRQGVDWSMFDAVVIRSPWDYQDRPDQFLSVLETIDASETRLFNSLEICRWNLNKIYLRELASRGVPIVPTLWPDSLEQETLRSAFSAMGEAKLVVKPTIGANADDTFVLERNDVQSWSLALEVFGAKPLLIQPFLRSVVEEGEYSLFYFGGKYSHAIVKRPKSGDFRVQEEHGGTMNAIEPNKEFTAVANLVMESLAEELVYARVDLVRLSDGSLALIELELIEPSLYFEQARGSAALFAKEFDRIASRG